MKLKISEVAKLVGISVRTLHHYDHIGLLKPDGLTESGYRLYSDKNLATLQQILFFKELDFPLKQIKKMIYSPSFNQVEALQLQRNMLSKRIERYETMLQTIDQTLRHMRGEIEMSNKEKFVGFDFTNNEYEEEARKRWGDDAIDRANEAIVKKPKAEQQAIGEEMNAIFRKFASLIDQAPAAVAVQLCVQEWYDFLNTNTGHSYSLAAFQGLGQMYVVDERFMNNIDQFGTGLAQFISEAITVFVEKRTK